MPDLLHILNSYPHGHPRFYEDASCWSFALGCGARAITCANIKLQDVQFQALNRDGTEKKEKMK